MRRVYRNVHIALISALVLAAVAFEASAIQRVSDAEQQRGDAYLASGSL